MADSVTRPSGDVESGEPKHAANEKVHDVAVESDASSADGEHAVQLDPEFVKSTVRRIDRFLVPAMLLGQLHL